MVFCLPVGNWTGEEGKDKMYMQIYIWCRRNVGDFKAYGVGSPGPNSIHRWAAGPATVPVAFLISCFVVVESGMLAKFEDLCNPAPSLLQSTGSGMESSLEAGFLWCSLWTLSFRAGEVLVWESLLFPGGRGRSWPGILGWTTGHTSPSLGAQRSDCRFLQLTADWLEASHLYRGMLGLGN